MRRPAPSASTAGPSITWRMARLRSTTDEPAATEIAAAPVSCDNVGRNVALLALARYAESFPMIHSCPTRATDSAYERFPGWTAIVSPDVASASAVWIVANGRARVPMRGSVLDALSTWWVVSSRMTSATVSATAPATAMMRALPGDIAVTVLFDETVATPALSDRP